MGFQEAVRHVFANYATFTERAPRSEFWWFVLFTFAVSIVLSLIDGAIFGGEGGFLSPLFSLAVLVPSVAVAVRRLHDTDRTGWWVLLGFVPLVGILVLIYFYIQPGTPGPNRFGGGPGEGGGRGRLADRFAPDVGPSRVPEVRR